MPLTAFQASITRILSVNRSEDSYLAGFIAKVAVVVNLVQAGLALAASIVVLKLNYGKDRKRL